MDLIQKTAADKVSKIVHGVIDGLCDRSSLQYTDYSKEWSLEEWWQMTDFIKDFCRNCVSNNWDKDRIAKELAALPDDYQSHIFDVINIRRSDLRMALIEATTGISQSKLEDFDWQVKLVLASDSLASIQEPLASVDFKVQSGDTKKTSTVELSQQDLKKMITSLEAANRVVTQMKT